MKVTLLQGGGGDIYYELGLLSGLVSKRINVDIIGNDKMRDASALTGENANLYNFRGNQDSHAPVKEKIYRVLKYYFKLTKYAARTDSKLFHILWLNKFIYFDITILNVYYKLLGKKLVFTAHNINMRERDKNDTWLNRLSLRFLYKIVDHIFVHTNKMKLQLIENFNIRESKVTVIPYGINNVVHKSELTRIQARKKLHVDGNKKVILFFGNIAPYKGLEYLILALVHLKEKNNNFRLIIAGRIKGSEAYWENMQRIIEEHALNNCVISKIEFIHDEEIEVYFKSADVLILPYTRIFQSGVLFLSYNFGLPVIATDVGSLKECVVEGNTGFICQHEDPQDLANKIDLYFHSDLYKNLEINREKIIKHAYEKYSWEKIAEKTIEVYKRFL